MKNNDKKTHKVYLRNLRQWVDVTYQEYLDFNRDIWAYRKKAQYHNRCMCPKNKIWLCDMDCLTCEFFTAGDTLSLDLKEADGHAWVDDIEDRNVDLQAIEEDSELLTVLLTELEQLSAHQQEICRLIMAGKSEREIANIMGYKNKSNLNYQKSNIFKILREKLKKFL